MSASLTLILPVHNAQRWLDVKAQMVLDELSQLATEFEIIIVDDGSTDDTHAVALELAAKFPQVTAIRQSLRYGTEAAERRALEVATGRFIIVPNEAEALAASDLHKLWRVRHDPEVVMVINQASAHRLDEANGHSGQPSTRGGSASPGIRMIRRDAMAQVGKPRSDFSTHPIVVGMDGMDAMPATIIR